MRRNWPNSAPKSRRALRRNWHKSAPKSRWAAIIEEKLAKLGTEVKIGIIDGKSAISAPKSRQGAIIEEKSANLSTEVEMSIEEKLAKLST